MDSRDEKLRKLERGCGSKRQSIWPIILGIAAGLLTSVSMIRHSSSNADGMVQWVLVIFLCFLGGGAGAAVGAFFDGYWAADPMTTERHTFWRKFVIQSVTLFALVTIGMVLFGDWGSSISDRELWSILGTATLAVVGWHLLLVFLRTLVR